MEKVHEVFSGEGLAEDVGEPFDDVLRGFGGVLGQAQVLQVLIEGGYGRHGGVCGVGGVLGCKGELAGAQNDVAWKRLW